MNILITGVAGFIGYHTAVRLIQEGHNVLGLDNLNTYYDVSLKKARLNLLKSHKNFTFYNLDITNNVHLLDIATKYKSEIIIHLAAQPGVRYSLIDPFAYIKNNVEGHTSVLEVCRKLKSFQRLIYASSSSVHGDNTKLPYHETDVTDNPVSLYAATKKSCELISQAYYNLFKLPMIGLRFFTVYGPYGRPDMAPFIFTKCILNDESIDLYNHGNMERDFTYIDDIVSGITATLTSNKIENRIYNLGNSQSIQLLDFVKILEGITNKKALLNYCDMEAGDVVRTFADITRAKEELNFNPQTNITTGLNHFVRWYKDYYKIDA